MTRLEILNLYSRLLRMLWRICRAANGEVKEEINFVEGEIEKAKQPAS